MLELNWIPKYHSPFGIAKLAGYTATISGGTALVIVDEQGEINIPHHVVIHKNIGKGTTPFVVSYSPNKLKRFDTETSATAFAEEKLIELIKKPHNTLKV